MPTTLFDIQKKYGESVYPLYKDKVHEPYMETPTGNGYLGEVLYDELEDKILCNECGKWFSQLSIHLFGKKSGHNMSSGEYREKYQILKKAALTSKKLSNIRSETMRERNKSLNFIQSRLKGNETVRNFSREKRSQIVKSWNNKLGHKNRLNLCPAQIIARMEIVKEIAKNSVLTSRDIRKYDRSLYENICAKYGSFKKASRILKIQYSRRGEYQPSKYEDVKIIASLRNWVLNHNDSLKLDTRNKKGFWPSVLPSKRTIYRHFGSWRRAKMMAGLDQLLEEMNHEKLVPTTQPTAIVNASV